MFAVLSLFTWDVPSVGKISNLKQQKHFIFRLCVAELLPATHIDRIGPRPRGVSHDSRNDRALWI